MAVYSTHNKYVSIPDWFTSLKKDASEKTAVSTAKLTVVVGGSSSGVSSGTGVSEINLYNKFVLTEVSLDKDALVNENVAIIAVKSEINNVGDLLTANGWYTTEYISIAANSLMTITSSVHDNYGLVFYDNTKTVISGTVFTQSPQDVQVPKNAVYYRISSNDVESFSILYFIENAYSSELLEQSNSNIEDYLYLDTSIPEGCNTVTFTNDSFNLLVQKPLLLTKDKNNIIKLSLPQSIDGVWELKTHEETLEPYIFTKYPVVTQYGVTMYADLNKLNLPDIYAGLPIDGTIVRNEDGVFGIPIDNTTIVLDNGKLTVVGGTGGDVATEVAWANVKSKPSWLTDDIIQYTEVEGLAEKLTEYVTFDEDEQIEGVKDFLNGIKINGLSITNSQEDVIYIDSNLVVRGGITMYADNTVDVPSLMESIVTDGTTIMNDGTKLYLNPNLELGGNGISSLVIKVGSESYTGTGTKDVTVTLPDFVEISDLLNYVTKSDLENYASEKYVTIAGNEDVTGVHPFVNGLKVGSSLINQLLDGVVYIDGHLAVKGGVTMYVDNGTIDLPNLYDGFPTDGTIIKNDDGSFGIPIDNSTIVLNNGKLTVVGGTDESGGLDDVNVTGTGNAVTGASLLNNVLTLTKGESFLTSHQTIYNLTFQAGAFSAKIFDPNGAAQTVNIPTKTSHITNDSSFVTSSYVDGKFVTIAGDEDVTGVHNFTNGLKVGDIKMSKSQSGVVFLEGNLVVSGAVTMFGTNSVTASTVMDGVVVDGTTIMNDGKKLYLNPDLQLGGGLDETALASYLTTNKYLTQTTGDTRYVTALGIDGNNLTWTKNGVVNNIAVPYATTAKELTSYSVVTFSKSDNSGKPCYLLIADVTSWYNVSSGATAYGVAGFVYGYRNGASPAYSMNINARCSYGKGYYSLNSSLKSIIEPRVVSYNSKYYLALYLQGSNRTFNFIGRKDNLLSSFTELQCSDGNGTYSGLSAIYKGSATGTSSKADSLSTSRTISITGHATGSGSFDGSSDLGINIAIPTRNVYINGTGYTVHSTITTDTTGVYAPTSGGTSGYVLKANGVTSIPIWVAQSSLSVGTASKLSTERTIWGQSFDGTASVSGNMTGVGSITMSGALSGATTGTFSSTLSGNEVVITNSGGTTSGHLRFSRASANYIAIPTGGTLAVNLDGSINAAGSDLIVRDGAVHPGTSGSTSLGRDGNLWNGLYLYGGSTSSAFNKFGINFGADVARISANSSGGLGIYAIGDLSKIYLRAGCSTSGASSTGLVIDANGNVQITGNLLVQGGVTMYATSNENPNPEFYAKDIYITGYSDGRYSKLTQGGSYVFHIPSSGAWASGWSAYDDTAGQSLGNAFGMYGSGSTLTYFYYGGTYSSPWIKLQKTSMGGTYWTLNDTSTNPYLKLVQGSNWYIQGYQSYLYLGAGSTNSLRISSDGSLYTPKTLTQGSDIRYKDIHKDILLSLATMAKAPSIEFHFKDDEQKSTHIGTSAQYWQSVSGVVTEDSEGRLGMDYSSLGVVMGISLAKELSRFESDTDRRIRLLEEENKRLKEEIEQLKMV